MLKGNEYTFKGNSFKELTLEGRTLLPPESKFFPLWVVPRVYAFNLAFALFIHSLFYSSQFTLYTWYLRSIWAKVSTQLADLLGLRSIWKKYG